MKREAVSRRGAVLVLMAFLLPVVLIICFFSVNLAYMLLLRTELRVATDAAARAAGSTFSYTGDEGSAVRAAQQFALLNQVGGEGLVLAPENVEFGQSIRPAEGARYQFIPSNGLKNAVRVNATAASRKLFAGGLFHGASFSPTQSATATSNNVDICLVLDRSSSMKLSVTDTAGRMSSRDPRLCQPPAADSRWMALSGAVDAFVEVLQATPAVEHVAVVTYASLYRPPCPRAPLLANATIDTGLSGDLSNVISVMSRYNTTVWGGNTEIHSGVVLGTSVLTNPLLARPNARKVMIVLTDGVYTADNPIPYAELAALAGIVVHAVTFSDGANQDDMRALAAVGGGMFYHAPDAATLEAVFRKLAAMSVLLTE